MQTGRSIFPALVGLAVAPLEAIETKSRLPKPRIEPNGRPAPHQPKRPVMNIRRTQKPALPLFTGSRHTSPKPLRSAWLRFTQRGTYPAESAKCAAWNPLFAEPCLARVTRWIE